MKIDDILDRTKAADITTPEALGTLIDALTNADDIPPAERSAFCIGYIAALAHAFGIAVDTGKPDDILAELITRETIWATKDWI